MAKVKVEITELRNNQNMIAQHIAQLETLNNRLGALLTRIESSWEGDASRAYINTMRNYALQASKMIEVLSEFKGYVNSAADTFETLDQKAAARINGSF